MSDWVKKYTEVARSRFSSVPFLLHRQQAGLEAMGQLGLPSRRLEEWKYSDPSAGFPASFLTMNGLPDERNPLDFPFTCESGIHYQTEGSGCTVLASSLPANVALLPLSQAALTHAAEVHAYLGTVLQTTHGFHALNTAMLRDGFFIYIPKGVQITTPIILSHWQTGVHPAVYFRHLVIAEEGSAVTLVEDYHGKPNSCYWTNVVTEIQIGPKAEVTHIKVQRESNTAYHFGELAVKGAESSFFDSHVFSVGGKWVRSDMNIALNAPNARCRMNGIYAPAHEQHMDHHTVVTHASSDCRSEQDYKGMLCGRSRAIFNGRIVVEKEAFRTVATQQNKNLLLSTDAEMNTKPELAIYADDVMCTHGATVGHLDEEALFYLASRGIPPLEAYRYLVTAFAATNLDLFSKVGFREWLGILLNEQVG